MAHYAQLDSENVVAQVFVGRDDVVEGIDDWETYYAPEGYTVKQTSYNTRGGVHYNPETGEPSADQSKALRFNYAGIGFTYDEERDAFIPPQPYASWVLDDYTCLWVPPLPYPEDGGQYIWDENAIDWTAVENETE